MHLELEPTFGKVAEVRGPTGCNFFQRRRCIVEMFDERTASARIGRAAVQHGPSGIVGRVQLVGMETFAPSGENRAQA